MNVSLTPALERLVNKKVAGGLYTSASEVVREGLRLLQERDEAQAAKLAALRADMQEGFAAIERGEHVSGPAAFAQLRKTHHVRRSRRKSA
jgi:antitoxin ParD1/3/4